MVEHNDSFDPLGRLGELVQQLTDKQSEVDEAELVLQSKKEEYRHLSEEVIPRLMERIGLDEVTTKSGAKVGVKKMYAARISEKNARAAYQWLAEHGHEAIVRREIKVNLAAGENDRSLDVLAALDELGVDATEKQAIHPQTLKAFVKEQIESGAEFPKELFSVWETYKTTVK